MADDLTARLQDAVSGEHDMTPHGADVLQAVNRIEELEAKLAKAVEALALADAALSGANMNMRVVEQKVKATLAEMKGQNDE